MYQDITLKFLKNFPILSEDVRSRLVQKLNVQLFKKEVTIQKDGIIPKNCFFVLDGCIRQYKIIDGEEKTMEFFTSYQAVISSEHYMNQTPSDYYLECIEDSILMVGEPEQDVKILSEFPMLQTVMMEVAEKEWTKTKNRITSFQLLSNQERYLDFLESRKELLNKVPNHQIASYLGITPETLSRIRKRLATTK